MANPKIEDLDVLRPPEEKIKLGGKILDISFIPSGIAFSLLQKQDKLVKLQKRAQKNPDDDEASREVFELMAEICAELTSYQHKEMDIEWLRTKTNIQQLTKLMQLVINSVMRSTETVKFDEDEEAEIKNVPKATKSKL